MSSSSTAYPAQLHLVVAEFGRYGISIPETDISDPDVIYVDRVASRIAAGDVVALQVFRFDPVALTVADVSEEMAEEALKRARLRGGISPEGAEYVARHLGSEALDDIPIARPSWAA
ncbi:hypothetical protein [Prosthecomicrobium sp. N25]|uniref:hypothetical protein n=1 Tax=Prosthecomicrobium sp. N25 TaxID=3129254 RepID=UPI003076CD24